MSTELNKLTKLLVEIASDESDVRACCNEFLKIASRFRKNRNIMRAIRGANLQDNEDKVVLEIAVRALASNQCHWFIENLDTPHKERVLYGLFKLKPSPGYDDGIFYSKGENPPE